MDRRPPLSRPTRLPLALLLAIVLAMGAAACGDDEEPTATGDQSGTTAEPSNDPYGGTTDGTDDTSGGGGDKPSVVATGIAFDNGLTLGAGEEFVFDNQDGTTHTLTADDGEFDSGNVAGGSKSDAMAAPDEPGDYAFHCAIHGAAAMSGTLTVAG